MASPPFSAINLNHPRGTPNPSRHHTPFEAPVYEYGCTRAGRLFWTDVALSSAFHSRRRETSSSFAYHPTRGVLEFGGCSTSRVSLVSMPNRDIPRERGHRCRLRARGFGAIFHSALLSDRRVILRMRCCKLCAEQRLVALITFGMQPKCVGFGGPLLFQSLEWFYHSNTRARVRDLRVTTSGGGCHISRLSYVGSTSTRGRSSVRVSGENNSTRAIDARH